MIGAIVLVVVFVLLTVISIVVPSLPPAEIIIVNWLGISAPGYEIYLFYIEAILNGIIYGVAAWMVFSIANLTVRRARKEKPEKADLATCPKCKNIVVASKTWDMTTLPSKTGKRTEMTFGLFGCPKCDKSFRRMLSKKVVF